ncbi:uncharacterized protein LOC144141365 [Haemaphysalis longicornis]
MFHLPLSEREALAAGFRELGILLRSLQAQLCSKAQMPSGPNTDEGGTSLAAPDGDHQRVEAACRPAADETADDAQRRPEQALPCDSPTGFSGQPKPEPHYAASLTRCPGHSDDSTHGPRDEGHPVSANASYGAGGHPVSDNMGYGAESHPAPGNRGRNIDPAATHVLRLLSSPTAPWRAPPSRAARARQLRGQVSALLGLGHRQPRRIRALRATSRRRNPTPHSVVGRASRTATTSSSPVTSQGAESCECNAVTFAHFRTKA